MEFRSWNWKKESIPVPSWMAKSKFSISMISTRLYAVESEKFPFLDCERKWLSLREVEQPRSVWKMYFTLFSKRMYSTNVEIEHSNTLSAVQQKKSVKMRERERIKGGRENERRGKQGILFHANQQFTFSRSSRVMKIVNPYLLGWREIVVRLQRYVNRKQHLLILW